MFTKMKQLTSRPEPLGSGATSAPQSQGPATTQSANNEEQPLKTVASSEEPAQLSAIKMYIIVVNTFLTIFLIALDKLIVGVAIPSITDEFSSLGDVGWYGSAYLLTSCAFMLFVGRIYTFYHPKYVYLTCLAIFEIGSAVCGAAPNSTALIVGRAIAGMGSAGLMQGAMIIIVYVVPLPKRPLIMGFGGLVFGVASAVGPLLGGAFTDGPGWRWCFYINLPCGAVVFSFLVLFLHIPEGMLKKKETTLKEKVSRLDPLGTFCFLPAIICLLLALQWGGVTYNWSDARVIVLLIVFALLFLAFLIIQRFKGENALVPSRIFFKRSMLAGMWFSFFTGGALQATFYYIPIWFQAIKGASAVKSGIMTLPMVLGLVVCSIAAGILTKKIGYYTPWMICSSVLTPIGAGLISTFTPSTGHSMWIGYQVIFGMGIGLGMQQTAVAAQTILSRKDVATGLSLIKFCETLGGALLISVANNLFDTHLEKDIANISGVSLGPVVNIGATDLRKMVPAGALSQVLEAYNDALRTCFFLVIASASCTIIGSLAMEWVSVKKGGLKPPATEEKDISSNEDKV